MAALLEEPENGQLLSEVISLVEAVALLPLAVNLWRTQNMYWTMLQRCASEVPSSAGMASGLISWSEAVKNLGEMLFFNVPAVLEKAKGAI
jgi:hypothetical protein